MADPSEIGVATPVLPLGMTLGEGPVWVAREQALWFVDIKGQRLHRFDPATRDHRAFDAPAMIGWALPAADGGFVAGFAKGPARFHADTGFGKVVTIEPDLPANRLNDATVGPDGRLWFGTMDNDEAAESGSLYRLDDDGRITASGATASITNGPAISPDGRILYHVDTIGGKIWAYDVAAGGTLSGKRLFVAIDPAEGHPDGVSIDSAGHVWLGVWGGGQARRYAPDGTLAGVIRVPGAANVTKVALGGPDLKTAYLTTARQGLSADALAQQPHAGALFACPVDVAGMVGAEVSRGLSVFG